MSTRAFTAPINPALGVVPPSLRLAHSSTRPAPARSAMIADRNVSTDASTSVRCALLLRPHFAHDPDPDSLRRRAEWKGSHPASRRVVHHHELTLQRNAQLVPSAISDEGWNPAHHWRVNAHDLRSVVEVRPQSPFGQRQHLPGGAFGIHECEHSRHISSLVCTPECSGEVFRGGRRWTSPATRAKRHDRKKWPEFSSARHGR